MTQNSNDPDKALDFKALALFEDSLNQKPDDRAVWIRRQAGQDSDLCEKALRLLERDHDSSDIIQTGRVILERPDDTTPPERIGAYRITGLIGQGGMGAVYHGKRDRGDFDHDAAIKVIRPGVLSDKLIERFEQERQTLASLIHPNIARLYDGGKTQDNAPYFIMEYVDGMPITDWVKKRDSSEADCLNLFSNVCKAINHAHKNLIVHRDITPSNVLVTESEEVKLIDFGIAKPHDDGTLEDFSGNSLASLSFTPGYAAPERIKGAGANTLSDIYSLGKLLASLFKDVSIKPELRAIILKATAENPEDRYETVRALLDDLDDYRRGLPVRAYATSTAYGVRKFISRHKMAAIFSVVAVTALLTAFGVTIFQYQRAEQNLARANARFDEVRELAKYQIFTLYDDLSRVAGNTGTRASLARKAQAYLASLASHPSASPALKLETARGYIRLARIFGVPAQPNLGDVVTARKNLTAAEGLLGEIDKSHPDFKDLGATLVALKAAQALILVHDDQDLPAAQKKILSAMAILESASSDARSPYWHMARRNLRYADLERADQAGDVDHLRETSLQVVADIDQWPEEMQTGPEAALDRGHYNYWQGLANYLDGKHEQAVIDFRAGHVQLSKAERQQKNDPMLLYLLSWTNYLGYGSAAQLTDQQLSGQFLDQAAHFLERLKSLQEGDASIIRLSMQLREAKAQLLADMGKFDEAIARQTALVADQESLAVAKPEPSQYTTWAYSHIILAYMYYDTEQRPATCEHLKKAEELLRPLAQARQLPKYMQNAAERLPVRIEQCVGGRKISKMNALFE
ncbi:serine/threonine protein kinase [hydrothermal vent metagenome]|uniref:Serine/threonine protein kinase n=1 Tax=hydrothermal vent metagenome TaxID=652676 RepID=A0A3B0SFA7_9ZZZZ